MRRPMTPRRGANCARSVAGSRAFRRPDRTGLRLLFPAMPGADIGGRFAVAATEGAVEMRDVAEAGVVGKGADLLMRPGRITQQPVNERGPLLENVVGEGSAFALEQPLNGAYRAALPPRD